VEPITATLIEHGYSVLFALVLLDQLGLPVPATPVVIAAGGLAGAGRLDPVLAIGLVTLAATLGDWVWYELGRMHGIRIVRVLCRISLEPDSCVRSTQGIFARHGPRSLLVAKWIPGLQTVAPPLAGAARMERLPFFAYTLTGALIWSCVFVGAGYALRDQLGAIGAMLAELGGLAVLLLGGGLALYLGFKVLQRHRFIRALRGARISPLELRDQLEMGEPVEVVDLRHPIDFATDPYLIPGARRVEPEELEHRHAEIPRDRDIVLYCT
jgi:membrane protein DedA with SNARE-associated domain